MLQNHIDGVWHTSEHEYKGQRIMIKMRKDKGSKVHIWGVCNTKVIKTFRFQFGTVDYILNLAKNFIDKKVGNKVESH